MDTNTDLNSLCELPEGHKGLHVSYKHGPAAWTGYARHSSEPITDYSAFDLDGPAHKQADNEIRDAMADVLLKAMGLEYPANNWPAHWRKSDEVFASPFSSHTEPSEASNKP